jgi:hypothetical protein
MPDKIVKLRNYEACRRGLSAAVKYSIMRWDPVKKVMQVLPPEKWKVPVKIPEAVNCKAMLNGGARKKKKKKKTPAGKRKSARKAEKRKSATRRKSRRRSR